jgi:acyl phosphate:glycerol-3-phosphate acyltransferase
MEWWQMLVIAVGSYLIGSTPTAYIIGRLRGVDVFKVGSGNMGATNTARALGNKNYFYLVLVLDAIKGMIPILLARLFIAPQENAFYIAETSSQAQAWYLATILAAVSAVIGHNWSVFALMITGKLKGGKGAATAFGTVLMVAPPLVIVVISIIGFLVIKISRFVSLGVLTMNTIATVWLIVLAVQSLFPPVYMLYVLIVSAMIYYRFRENIRSLLAGTERRFGESA